MCADSGSAAVEFVLVMAPLATLAQLLLVIIVGSLLRGSVAEQSAALADFCSLADASSTDAYAFAIRQAPSWMKIERAWCTWQGDYVTSALQASGNGPLGFLRAESEWVAVNEVSR